VIPNPKAPLDRPTQLRWEVTKAAFIAATEGVPIDLIVEDAREGAQIGHD